MTKNILITGSSGFIGSHLAKRLKQDRAFVVGIDHEDYPYGSNYLDKFFKLDLRYETIGRILQTIEIDEVYHLASDMGGIAYITKHLADIAFNNSLINLNVIDAAKRHGKPDIKFLFSSSACIYPAYRQKRTDLAPLKECEAMPAEPEEGYGWEKLYMEKMCEWYHKDHGLDVRVVRFHNCYGSPGTWTGGKEKSPAAACRKVAELPADGGELEIWGDGEQTRSYMHINDCVEGLARLMASDYRFPLNMGRDEMVSINELFDTVAAIAGKKITKRYNLTAPQGVRGRNSDNTRLRNVLGWEPQFSLKEGLALTFPWIADQVANANRSTKA